MRNEDIERLQKVDYIDWNRFQNKTIYITGATGLIGSNIVESLLECAEAKVVIQVRDEAKARNKFGDKVTYCVGDLLTEPNHPNKVDYIIHCANPTSSQYFVNSPVETITTSVSGIIKMLDFARKKSVEGFVFLSTMEVYGTPFKGNKVSEEQGGSFDTSVVRNCYPLSKMTCESLCAAYASEYGVHAKVVRLTQTFGPGVNYDDKRVFAEFARCAIENRDIVLKTKGKTERSYLYTLDAVTAILTVLLYGKDGEVYTAANEETYCSIYEMASMVADMYGGKVVISEDDISKYGYANTLFMDLDTKKLRNLGWNATINLKDSFSLLVEGMKENS